MISATAETLIFILLGVEVVTSVSQGELVPALGRNDGRAWLSTWHHQMPALLSGHWLHLSPQVAILTSLLGWHTGFILAAYFLCLIFRAVAVFGSSLFINRMRRHKITFKVACRLAVSHYGCYYTWIR